MEDFQIDFVVDRGAYAKTLKLPLKRFTLVGATTRAGMLSAPLRDRFGIVHHLDYYEPAELQRIVERSARVLDVRSSRPARARSPSAAAARRASRTGCCGACATSPKCARTASITAAVADEALRARRRRRARARPARPRVSRARSPKAYGGGPVGINAIAATLTEDLETLEDVVEPYLLKIGFVQRTAQRPQDDAGRVRAPRREPTIGR